MKLLTFNSLFHGDPDRVVGFTKNKPIPLSLILRRTNSLAKQLSEFPEHNWVLASGSTINFLCGFLALLVAGKEILLPPNNLHGTINETLVDVEGLLTDLDIDTGFKRLSLLISPDDEAAQDIELDTHNLYVQICTSGSTGEPKQIRKSLATLEDEVNALERLWGNIVTNHTFISTVSHQHIYGLLFRVLWPLLSNRPFLDENIEYPEQIEVLSRRYAKLVLATSPAYLKRMSDVLDRDSLRDHVSMIVSSGGPLGRETSLLYRDEFGVAPTEVLGSTETGGIAWRQQQAGQETLWQRFEDVEVRRHESTGVLMVKSPFCFSKDWYEMGDSVEIVDETHFRLLGRVDRIVKVEEKRISLDRMETVLAQSALVDQARIVVLAGDRTVLGAVCVLTSSGEELLANSGRRVFSAQLKEHLAAYFDRVSLPRKWRYIPDFPYNTQGKITQANLLRLFENNE
jgi:acyl-coenzyme A synthetase/AMP-(fatty) acid ligase